MIDLTPPFEHDLPLWEVRVGAYRVFYDVAEKEERIHIRAVRRKSAEDRTEDLI